MYDNQDPAILRLKQGYEVSSGDFVFELYNKSGVKTVDIDSNGDVDITGKFTNNNITIADDLITITDGAITRMAVGNYVGGFGFGIYDASGNVVFGLADIGVGLLGETILMGFENPSNDKDFIIAHGATEAFGWLQLKGTTGDFYIYTSESFNVNSGNNINLDATVDILLTAGTNCTVLVSGDINLSASDDIFIQANDNIEFSHSGGSITVFRSIATSAVADTLVLKEGKVGIKDSTPSYELDVNGDIRAVSKFGCNGQTPQSSYSLGGAASDLTSVVALANNIRTALINNGIGTT
jgi:hypothetical protein